MLKFLIEKEFKQFVRNPFLPKMALFFPMLIILVLPLVVTMDVKKVKVCVVDNDGSSTSGRLIKKISASDYFVFKGKSVAYNQALSMMEHGQVDIILQIPQDFEKLVVNRLPAQVQISANATDATKGGLGSNYLAAVVNQFSPTASVIPQISQLNLFNPGMNYRSFMLPALMGMVIIIIAGIFPAFAVVGEKESGTLEQINVTPVKRSQFIIAKLIPYWIIGLTAMSIAFLVALLVYGFSAAGSYLTIYAATLLITVAMSSIGLIISNYSSTYQQAIFLFFFVMIISLLMSGLFTPTTSMPAWAKMFSNFLPPKYFMEIMRSVYLKGSGFRHLIPQFSFLGLFALVLGTIAVFTYRKRA